MKQVLITGASSGIGRQLAIDYAAEGWRVIACGQNQDRLADLAENNDLITPLSFTVSNIDQVKQAIESLEDLPELIILNAGTCEYIEHGVIDSALFKRVFDVNVFGLLHCIEAMQSRFTSSTHLVIVGSSASYVPLPRAEAYGASKAAVAYLTHTLAIDLAPLGVTVTLVNPGFVKTPLTDKNDFQMPMLVTADYASEKIRQGISAGKIEINFPLKFTLLLKFIALLPLRLQLMAIKQFTGK
ncbi:SDR family NAD(P)-dependent oxidoreductase [Photobacterium lipolyticum]|uniref:Short-chain dehydrogenase n=1 Tax=Photobacterium lipolyticum TaxID=266810 RepID=A0A2T3N353_9GAMM|nr:SDR family NAD(P)-dependent oxidoreductase [Photobacterium lipolyticum]PSW06781.1 short-chain dehydrogenase [Photobacterium lipolyticum]